MNVVFDLGGVLLAWHPGEIGRRVTEDPATLTESFIDHPDWLELDRGTLDYEDAFARAVNRTGLAESLFRDAAAMIPYTLVVQQDVLDLVREIDRLGHRLFILSNMHTAVARSIEQRHDFWDLFEGIVFSCDVGTIKPELGIDAIHFNDAWQARGELALRQIVA